MVSHPAEGNQDLKYLHNWCKEVRKEIFSERRHLAQRVEAEGGKSGPGGEDRHLSDDNGCTQIKVVEVDRN